MFSRISLILIFAVSGAGTFAQSRAVPGCGSIENAYGPFDYTNPVHFQDLLPRVEQHHFDAGVEALRGHVDHPNGLGGDLDYTLRAFPNHHRALYTMARYHLTKEDYKRPAMRYSAECYFQRAMLFAPSDGVVRMIYGVYLYKSGSLPDARVQFEQAVAISPTSAEVHYNFGLVLVELKEYEAAKQHAETAYELGYPMPGLRNKLKRAGAW